MKKVRIATCIFAIAALVIAMTFTACGGATPGAVPVMAQFDAGATMRDTNGINIRGTVESVTSRNVYSTLGFLVEEVFVRVGDGVSVGQSLAALDTGDLELMIAQQRVELELMRVMAEATPPQRAAELEAMRRMGGAADLHILQAQSAVTAAGMQATFLQRDYEIIRAEVLAGNSAHMLAAEGAVTAARLHLDSILLQMETADADLERFTRLYEAGGLSRNDLRQMQNAITQAQSGLEHAQNAYADAMANLALTIDMEQRMLEQTQLALEAAHTGQRDAQNMLTATRTATNIDNDMLRNNITAMELAAEIEATQLRANVELMEIALQLMERQLENSLVPSPIDGMVTAVFTAEGATAMGPLFIVEDTNNLRIITHVREYEIGKIQPGVEVEIRADATGDAVHAGIITRISPAANIHSHIVEFEVEVAIVSQDTGLRIGMNARIFIDLD